MGQLSGAVKRTKWRGLIRNVCVAAGNAAKHFGPGTEENTRLRERLGGFASGDDPLLAEHAQWALRKLETGA